MDDYYLMTPLEIARGFLIGTVGDLPPSQSPEATPRRALEDAVRPALEHGPCGVAFSGGRDSSLVLAVATHVARRDGLPDPIPITRVFPGVEESDETHWQELVVRHLGLGDWDRFDIHDELDIIGPLAQRHLRHGVVWPPAIATNIPILERLPGGSLLDGEGGDEALGVQTHRVAALTNLVRYPRPFRLRRVRRSLGVFAPRSVVRARQLPHVERSPWLRPSAAEAFTADALAMLLDLPLSFATSVRTVPVRRGQAITDRNRAIQAAEYGVRLRSPLVDPEFVHAVARDGGFLGRGDRTTMMRFLASDLLPDEILARTSKAVFNRGYVGARSKAFVERWDGSGVDASLVDPERLREHWLHEIPSSKTGALLQQAWLASGGATTDS